MSNDTRNKRVRVVATHPRYGGLKGRVVRGWDWIQVQDDPPRYEKTNEFWGVLLNGFPDPIIFKSDDLQLV